MTPYSITLAWKLPWMKEPGKLQSMGSLRVGHDSVTSLSLFTFMHWRRKWQPTALFLPGESQGRWSLVGCRLWSRTESDTTEATQQQQHVTQMLSFLHEFLTIIPKKVYLTLASSEAYDKGNEHMESACLQIKFNLNYIWKNLFFVFESYYHLLQHDRNFTR